MKPIPTEWLPVLSNIHPQELRRKEATLKEYKKVTDYPNLPIHEYWMERVRLKSRNPFCVRGAKLLENDFNMDSEWQIRCSQGITGNNNLVLNFTIEVEGFDLQRRSWAT